MTNIFEATGLKKKKPAPVEAEVPDSLKMVVPSKTLSQQEISNIISGLNSINNWLTTQSKQINQLDSLQTANQAALQKLKSDLSTTLTTLKDQGNWLKEIEALQDSTAVLAKTVTAIEDSVANLQKQNGQIIKKQKKKQ